LILSVLVGPLYLILNCLLTFWQVALWSEIVSAELSAIAPQLPVKEWFPVVIPWMTFIRCDLKQMN
jgi:hypothetical protein